MTPRRPWISRVRLLALVTLVLVGPALYEYSRTATGSSVGRASAATCASAVNLPASIPIDGAPLASGQFDESCHYLYLANPNRNRIEAYDVTTGSLDSPIAVGAGPRYFAITPDGTTMYVSNSGENTISVVDLTTRIELRRLVVPPDQYRGDNPGSIALANNGLAMFLTKADPLGYHGCCGVMELNLTTETIRWREELGNSHPDASSLVASSDGSSIMLVDSGTNWGFVQAYDSASDSWVHVNPMMDFVNPGGVSAAGGREVVASFYHTYVLEDDLTLAGTVDVGGWNIATSDDGRFGYAFDFEDPLLHVIDLVRFLEVIAVPVPERGYWGVDLSASGDLLASLTATGFMLVAPPHCAPGRAYCNARPVVADAGAAHRGLRCPGRPRAYPDARSNPRHRN